MTNYDPIEEPEGKGRHVMKVSVNKQELFWLKEAMVVLNQHQLGTALKQLARLGYENVVQDKKMNEFLTIVSENQRKNFEQGRNVRAIIDANVDPLIQRM